MSFNPTSPVTGSAQTGLTSPTYTLTADQAPDPSGKQFAVTALGGTQSGVTVHAPSAPFTITMFRPKVFKNLGLASDGITRTSNGKNTYTILVRKGVACTQSPSAGGIQDGLLQLTLKIDVPVGADVMDPPELRAAMSLLIGVLNANSSAITETLIAGTL
jgi:hypothetical protein